ncbi:CLUMA_CG016180, isoform A [Clunio marinus]|uniref:Moesin/ezrin/radixin homolog 1 n=1 Tax=Clunio marinus TaxID=568069 RepID=A0A1J1ISU0_9DIPT|nr:CLUMA_CG016180, isoform A [Clunio marinus]
MLSAFRKKKIKSLPIRVCSLDSNLEFNLDYNATGLELYDQCCRALGLREEWYFGLQYEDTKGNICWLKKEKRVVDQNINKENCVFMFIAKFFPENVQDDLIQEITQHLFFLQIKQAILTMEYYCPPEASVLLASYYVQAKYGDYDDSLWNKTGMLSSEDLLPQRVIDQYSMTPQMWFERIKTWYADHKGMSRDEAEMEYLKIAQDLDMFGVNYFPIANKKHSDLWLGITSLGLNIYERENKLTPKTVFQWSEIKNVSFDDKKFTIKPIDKGSPNFVFFSTRLRMNELILDLCIGNHELFMRRRKPDTMEIQQMKAQAKEEKQRRQIERNKLAREKQMREQAERDKAVLEARLHQLQEEMRNANAALKRSEEAAELLEQKNHLAEEEAMLLSRKAMEVEQEILKLKNYALKTEEEKLQFERKSREAETLTARLVEESQKRASEADRLKTELINARLAEREAKTKLFSFLSATIASPEPTPVTVAHIVSSPERVLTASTNSLNESNGAQNTEECYSYDFVENNDINEISLEIERERTEYLAKFKQVQSQLKDLRSEIEMLKISESEFDRINNEQLKLGENKYSTLKKALKQKFFFL